MKYIMKFQKKYFFPQKNVCFKSLFSNQLPIPGFKHLSAEHATVVATGVRQTNWIWTVTLMKYYVYVVIKM